MRRIQWLRNISNLEKEAFIGKIPMGALPTKDGDLTEGALHWSYNEGDVVRVQVLLKSPDELWYEFRDVEQGHSISGIPRDAFTFLD